MNSRNEIWKAFKFRSSIYYVSNIGRIKNSRGRILAQDTSQRGYCRVKLCSKGKIKAFKVHRLVGKCFIPNPKGLTQLHHKDSDKKNNKVDNLEWCDNKTNNILKTNKSGTLRRPVMMMSLNYVFIRTFGSVSEASRMVGISRYGISSVCNGVQKMCGGYKWKYI